MKHRIPPMEKSRWWDMPHVFLDFEFDSVPMISIENPTANVILCLSSHFKLEGMIMSVHSPKKFEYKFYIHVS